MDWEISDLIKMQKLASLSNIEANAIPEFKFGISGPQMPGRVLAAILPYLFGIAGIVLVFMLISAGFKLMTSAGDPKAMQAAQSKITTSVLGIVIMFVSFWIVKIILQFFGIGLTLF